MIRFFDIIISILVLFFFSPLLIIISILILLIDGRPLTFKQSRVGYNGKKFIILKFRTMKNFISKNKVSKLTTLGKILRSSSLDEFPQFINVLKKDNIVDKHKQHRDETDSLINKNRDISISALTEKESKVCKLLTQGYSYKEIAEIIGYTTYTVNQKSKNIYKKLGVRSRAELSYKILN